MTRLLVVDDDTQLRESLVRDLAKQGYDVAQASTVDEAIVLVSQPDKIVDVLLTDLRMPSRDGFDLLEVVQVKSPHTRSVLISAFASARDYDAALDRGAVAVVSKPFSRAEVHAAVLLAIECGKGLHGSLHGVSLLDVLQLYHLGHRSVEVHLSGAHAGMIVLDHGEIIHATCGAQTGREALQQLLIDDEGAIRTRPRTREFVNTLDQPFQTLVLDLMRSSDEENRESGELAEIGEMSLEEWGAPAREAPPVDADLAARWRLACSDWGRLPAGAAVFCVGISSKRALEASAAAVVQQTLALHEDAMAFAGGAHTGVLEIIVGQLGFLLLWDLARDALLVLVQDVTARNAPAYFRARAAFLSNKAGAIFAGSEQAVSA